MERREFILSLFDPSGFGLEVGPSYEPLLPKSEGYNVEVVDHADAATLRDKYRNLPTVDSSLIEEVDHVSDGRSLVEVIGRESCYDFVLACHTIEHVTDIVRFIRDCETLLKPDGLLVLIVPDKRFCFDALLPVSTVGQALQAFHEARTRHSPGKVFDHLSMRSRKAGAEIWLDPDLDDIELLNSKYLAQEEFEKGRANTNYVDIHGWQFTPSSFRYLIKTLRELGYIKSGEITLKTNGAWKACAHEFYITLSKVAPKIEIPDIDLLKASEAELLEIKLARASSGPALALAEKDQKIQSLTAELAKAREQLAQERLDRQELLASTSWKATAPLRYLKSAFLPGKATKLTNRAGK